MAEKKITLEAGTPEAVAYLLFQGVAKAEEQRFTTDGTVVADRKWLLDTYAECLLAVTQPQMR